ncbi:hypothetical protein BN77_0385 [Rhizobium mesoamericanum STM3625]|uniref:Uncharacterized protein n=1 Tax=Rhizobium mesoamericanum STM3625 TaxID=1211777 RepID=K0Q0I2_9HYPH|nr:hypothetical protein BN77_0385 [Rhizobium mesoamericanum STM3625]
MTRSPAGNSDFKKLTVSASASACVTPQMGTAVDSLSSRLENGLASLQWARLFSAPGKSRSQANANAHAENGWICCQFSVVTRKFAYVTSSS